MSLVNVQALKDNRAIGVVQLNQHNLQVVIGPQVQSVKDEMAGLMHTVGHKDKICSIFQRSWIVMAHGVHSGIMSLTVSALLTCYRSRFQTWILPLPLHYRGAESAPDARRIWLQPLEKR